MNRVHPDIKTRFIDPFNDFGFKRLFGQESSKAFLIDFLNEVLELPEADVIVEVSFLNSENTAEADQGRSAYFDLYCRCGDGSYVIIELQRARQEFFADRALYYSTWPVQHQAALAKKKITGVGGISSLRRCISSES